MPLFTADCFALSMTIDEPFFLVGNNISGLLTIQCAEKCSIRGIILKYLVFEKRLVGSTPDALEDTAAVAATQVFCKQIVMAGSRKGAPVDVAVGTYNYPFSINVPSSVPQTLHFTYVGDSARCCTWCCCCECSGVGVSIGVRHVIAATVIIPFALSDKTKTWNVTVKRATHPQTFAGQCQSIRWQLAPAFNCANCCLSCTSCAPEAFVFERNDFRLEVHNPIVCISQDPKIHFSITGTLARGFSVFFVRRTKIFGASRRSGLEVEKILGCLAFFPRNTLSGSVIQLTGDIDLSLVTEPLVSVMGSTIASRFYLCVRFIFDNRREDACGVAVRPQDEARVPITVCETIDERAPITTGGMISAISHQSLFGHNPHNLTLSTGDLRAIPLSSSDVPVPSGVNLAQQPSSSYAYIAPPPGTRSQFAPVAAVAETNLPANEWSAPSLRRERQE